MIIISNTSKGHESRPHAPWLQKYVLSKMIFRIFTETDHNHIQRNDLTLHTVWLLSRYSSPPGRNDRHSVDDIFRCIFVNEILCILVKILLKPEGSNWQYLSIGLDNGMAPKRRQDIIWTNSLTHICGTRGKWVKEEISAIYLFSRIFSVMTLFG